MFMSIKTLFDSRKYLLTIFKARASTDHFFCVCVSGLSSIVAQRDEYLSAH